VYVKRIIFGCFLIVLQPLSDEVFFERLWRTIKCKEANLHS
jgi:hypothetical protein